VLVCVSLLFYFYSAFSNLPLAPPPKSSGFPLNPLDCEDCSDFHKGRGIVSSNICVDFKFRANIFAYRQNCSLIFLLRGKNIRILLSTTQNNNPWFSVEVKTSDITPLKNLNYYKERLKIPFNYQIVQLEGIDLLKDDIRIMSASKFLSAIV